MGFFKYIYVRDQRSSEGIDRILTNIFRSVYILLLNLNFILNNGLITKSSGNIYIMNVNNIIYWNICVEYSYNEYIWCDVDGLKEASIKSSEYDCY